MASIAHALAELHRPEEGHIVDGLGLLAQEGTSSKAA